MRRRDALVTTLCEQLHQPGAAYGVGVTGWRAAMTAGLYGPDGFFVREPDPSRHFRTSVHASPLFAGALLRLIERVDAALRRPKVFDLVDVGAGRGELLSILRASLPAGLAERVRMTAVEVAPRPDGLDPGIGWRRDVPDGIVGLLVATEWLDNVPLDVADRDDAGRLRKVLVDPATGAETLGGPMDAADLFWLRRWWPGGGRAEIGWTRDTAWADAVHQVRRGCALAVDYGHLRSERPAFGTLTGFRGGRQVVPVPDGSCDVTAHVAMDSVAAAAGTPYRMIRQRAALRALGVDGARPPIELARTDPAGYMRQLAAAGAAAELTEPAGLGGHWWLLHTVGIPELAGSASLHGRGSMLL
jgi:SAM-dependent MidA family methyltransferase